MTYTHCMIMNSEQTGIGKEVVVALVKAYPTNKACYDSWKMVEIETRYLRNAKAATQFGGQI